MAALLGSDTVTSRADFRLTRFIRSAPEKPGVPRAMVFRFYVRRQRHLAHVNFQDLFAALAPIFQLFVLDQDALLARRVIGYSLRSAAPSAQPVQKKAPGYPNAELHMVYFFGLGSFCLTTTFTRSPAPSPT